MSELCPCLIFEGIVEILFSVINDGDDDDTFASCPTASQACVRSQQYEIASEFVRSVRMVHVDKSDMRAGLTLGEYVQYYHYAGLCLTATKHYSDAMDHFMDVVIAPFDGFARLAALAFQKAMLLSLLAHGRQLALPE